VSDVVEFPDQGPIDPESAAAQELLRLAAELGPFTRPQTREEWEALAVLLRQSEPDQR
jgi:hypothetical protein